MIRNILIRLYNKMMLESSSNHKFYENHIKYQITGIIERNLWGEPKWKNVLSNMWKARVSLSVLIVSIIILISLFTFGYKNLHLNRSIDKRNGKIISLSLDKSTLISIIEDKDKEIDSLSKYLKSREYLEFIINKKAHVSISRLSSDKILTLMTEQADKYKIPYSIYFRLIEKESGFKFITNKSSGATGYMQVMPSTFKSFRKILKLKGGHTESNNIKVGSYMLRRSHNYWRSKGKSDKDSWRFTLAEYNAGRGKMQIKNDENIVTNHYIPGYTESYVNYIMKYYKN